jgi:hypothetical protein
MEWNAKAMGFFVDGKQCFAYANEGSGVLDSMTRCWPAGSSLDSRKPSNSSPKLHSWVA